MQWWNYSRPKKIHLGGTAPRVTLRSPRRRPHPPKALFLTPTLDGFETIKTIMTQRPNFKCMFCV